MLLPACRESNLRSLLTQQLQYLSLRFYHYNSTGALQNKLLRELEQIQLITTNILVTLML
ncbi:MAG: hypothetical protein F6K28_18055 [Microcoleus sp. SIO2G3]|nr:hypothetical protein [Microcoleus sp. SIO2G3]